MRSLFGCVVVSLLLVCDWLQWSAAAATTTTTTHTLRLPILYDSEEERLLSHIQLQEFNTILKVYLSFTGQDEPHASLLVPLSETLTPHATHAPFGRSLVARIRCELLPVQLAALDTDDSPSFFMLDDSSVLWTTFNTLRLHRRILELSWTRGGGDDDDTVRVKDGEREEESIHHDPFIFNKADGTPVASFTSSSSSSSSLVLTLYCNRTLARHLGRWCSVTLDDGTIFSLSPDTFHSQLPIKYYSIEQEGGQQQQQKTNNQRLLDGLPPVTYRPNFDSTQELVLGWTSLQYSTRLEYHAPSDSVHVLFRAAAIHDQLPIPLLIAILTLSFLFVRWLTSRNFILAITLAQTRDTFEFDNWQSFYEPLAALIALVVLGIVLLGAPAVAASNVHLSISILRGLLIYLIVTYTILSLILWFVSVPSPRSCLFARRGGLFVNIMTAKRKRLSTKLVMARNLAHITLVLSASAFAWTWELSKALRVAMILVFVIALFVNALYLTLLVSVLLPSMAAAGGGGGGQRRQRKLRLQLHGNRPVVSFWNLFKLQTWINVAMMGILMVPISVFLLMDMFNATYPAHAPILLAVLVSSFVGSMIVSSFYREIESLVYKHIIRRRRRGQQQQHSNKIR